VTKGVGIQSLRARWLLMGLLGTGGAIRT